MKFLKKTKDNPTELTNVSQTIQSLLFNGWRLLPFTVCEAGRMWLKQVLLNHQNLIQALIFPDQWKKYEIILLWKIQLGSTGYTKLEELTGEPIVGTGDLTRFNSSKPNIFN